MLDAVLRELNLGLDMLASGRIDASKPYFEHARKLVLNEKHWQRNHPSTPPVGKRQPKAPS